MSRYPGYGRPALTMKNRCPSKGLGHRLGILASLLTILLTAGSLNASENDTWIAIKAGTIVPVSSGPIVNGVILIRNGKIEAVGQNVEIPEEAEVIDATDKVVIPGLIDAYTTLADRRDDEQSVTPDVKAIDAFDFYGDYRPMLAGGVTTAYVSPGQRRLISGLGAVVKLAGESPEARCLDSTAGLRITLGDLSKYPPAIFEPPLPPEPNHPLLPEEKQLPTTRMAQLAMLRELLDRANPETEIPTEVLEGKVPVRINCHNVQDIRNAISLAKAFDLKLIIEGGTEAYKAIDSIKENQIPVVFKAPVLPGRNDPRDYTRDIALGQINPATPAALAEAGIQFALSAPTDSEIADLTFIAGHAVTQGLSPEAALKAITMIAAQILGIADRVGSIETGKDADLVILTDQPFSLQAVVDRTLVNGQTVYTRKVEAQENEQPTLAVRAGRIFTASAGQIDNGLILIKDTKIIYVGPEKDIPEGTTVLDASDSVVIPGMIDIHSYLGLHADSERVSLNPLSPLTGPNSNRLRLVSLAQAVTPSDKAFAEAMRQGVTSVLLAPPTTGLLCGNAALLKTAGDRPEDNIVKEYAAVKFSMVSNSQRLAQIWQARDLLKRAKDYAERWDAYEREHQEYEHRKPTAKADEIKEPDRPRRDPDMELLRGLFQRKMPAIVQAERADEIRNALQVYRNEYNLDTIILGGADSFRIVDELKESRADVAIGPDILQYDKGRAINNADILVRQGLRVAFNTSATSGTQYLPINAAYAVRYGMDKNKALAAVTSFPAQMLNVNDRIGSIDTGKDADLVILSGEPFEFTSRVEKVIVSGSVVFEQEK